VALIPHPDACIEKTYQGKSSLRIRELFVAIVLVDFLRVILLGLEAFGLAHNALRVRYAELGGHVDNDTHRNIHGIGEKGSQESERADLYPKPRRL
jgi:hypothetical protein